MNLSFCYRDSFLQSKLDEVNPSCVILTLSQTPRWGESQLCNCESMPWVRFHSCIFLYDTYILVEKCSRKWRWGFEPQISGVDRNCLPAVPQPLPLPCKMYQLCQNHSHNSASCTTCTTMTTSQAVATRKFKFCFWSFPNNFNWILNLYPHHSTGEECI